MTYPLRCWMSLLYFTWQRNNLNIWTLLTVFLPQGIHSLELEMCSLSDKCMNSLLELLQSLQGLRLINCMQLYDLNFLIQFSQLTHLSLTGITLRGMCSLCLFQCTDMKHPNRKQMDNWEITVVSYRYTVRALSNILLGRAVLNFFFLCMLAAWKWPHYFLLSGRGVLLGNLKQGLEYLSLSACTVKACDLDALTTSRHVGSLRQLDLSQNNFGRDPESSALCLLCQAIQNVCYIVSSTLCLCYYCRYVLTVHIQSSNTYFPSIYSVDASP